MSTTNNCDFEPRPPSSRDKSGRGEGKRRRSNKKKRDRGTGERPHRYPTRLELEGGRKKADLKRKLGGLRAAEEQTRRRFEEVKLAGRLESLVTESDHQVEEAATAGCGDQTESLSATSTGELVSVARRCDDAIVAAVLALYSNKLHVTFSPRSRR